MPPVPTFDDQLNLIAAEAIAEIFQVPEAIAATPEAAEGVGKLEPLKNRANGIRARIRLKVTALCEGEYRQALLPLIQDRLSLTSELDELNLLLGGAPETSPTIQTQTLVELLTDEVVRRITDVTVGAGLEYISACKFSVPYIYPKEFLNTPVENLDIGFENLMILTDKLACNTIRDVVVVVNKSEHATIHGIPKTHLVQGIARAFGMFVSLRTNKAELAPFDLRQPLPLELASVLPSRQSFYRRLGHIIHGETFSDRTWDIIGNKFRNLGKFYEAITTDAEWMAFQGTMEDVRRVLNLIQAQRSARRQKV